MKYTTMIRKFFGGIACVSLLLITACESANDGAEKDSVDTSVSSQPELPAMAFDPDPTDSIPGRSYPAYNSDTAIASIIRRALQAEKNLGDGIDTNQRKFKYHAFDLNNDSTDEYMVALYTPSFCGTGGCTAYILNADGTVDSRFSVVDFPVYVAASTTNGWQDLIMYSKGNHHVKRGKSNYPSNPSVQPKYKGDPPNMAPQLLSIWDAPYPAFSW